MHLNIIKATYNKPIANTILNGENWNFSKVRNEKRVSTLSTFIQHSLIITNQGNKTGRRNKRNSNMKVRNQTTLFYMVFYIFLHNLINKSPEKLHQKLLDIINALEK
jgi:hypothetical protein